ESDSTESETETDGETSCAAVSGKKFVMESTDCGPVPGSTCTWYVDFDLEGGFDYTLSDYNISGTYSCDGNTVTGEHNNGSYTGIVDEDPDDVGRSNVYARVANTLGRS
ncbi:MAG: hypothetical protein ACPG4T_03455, partial [Nannocystaceae bacterium]